MQIISLKYLPKYSLSLIEIIYNPKLEPKYQYIQLFTYFLENLQGANQTFSN